MKGEHDQDVPAASQPGDEEAVTRNVPRLRLRSLKVHEFRDVRPGTELSFGDGFHLVLGKNGSGKSTLLKLLAAVSVLDFSDPFFAETPFHVEASLDVGPVNLHAEIRRTFEPQRVTTVSDEYTDQPPRDEAEFTVRIEHVGASFCQWIRARSGEDVRSFTSDPRRSKDEGHPLDQALANTLRLSIGRALSLGARVIVDGLERLHPEVWPAFLHATHHPGTSAPFDESLRGLNSIVRGGLSVVRGKRIHSRSPWLPHALDFDAKGEPITLELSDDTLLKAAIEQLGFDSARAYFGPGASVSGGWRYSAPSFQFFRRGVALRRHDQLSFGQQRLFSFAWYLACNPDLAIADELVNGLHSDWIDWCVDALGDRQCFLTSQNPILVDMLPFRSEEEIRHGIILCESIHDAARDVSELRWRQLDDRESDLIARALQQSRLDLLSDLLRALDLW